MHGHGGAVCFSFSPVVTSEAAGTTRSSCIQQKCLNYFFIPLPHQKSFIQTLNKQICVQVLSSCCYRHEDQFLFHYKPETVDFALERLCSLEHGDNDTESRLVTLCCNDPAPLIMWDHVFCLLFPSSVPLLSCRPSSQCSVLSNVEDEIEALKDKLNVTDIDQVVDSIKWVAQSTGSKLFWFQTIL